MSWERVHRRSCRAPAFLLPKVSTALREPFILQLFRSIRVHCADTKVWTWLIMLKWMGGVWIKGKFEVSGARLREENLQIWLLQSGFCFIFIVLGGDVWKKKIECLYSQKTVGDGLLKSGNLWHCFMFFLCVRLILNPIDDLKNGKSLLIQNKYKERFKSKGLITPYFVENKDTIPQVRTKHLFQNKYLWGRNCFEGSEKWKILCRANECQVGCTAKKKISDTIRECRMDSLVQIFFSSFDHWDCLKI